MRDAIILGSGRSGTSMVAGLFHGAGYSMGPDLLPALRGNRKGLFESHAINMANEAGYRHHLEVRPTGTIGKILHWSRLASGQLWLGVVPIGAEIRGPSEHLASRFAEWTSRRPFAFKDPRFSYTLGMWEPSLEGCVFICVFREPQRTVDSILRECREERYLRNVKMTSTWALDLWLAMYGWILQIHDPVGRFVYVHFNQVLTGSGIDRLERATGASFDRGFVEPQLSRATTDPGVPSIARATYEELCRRAGYRD